MKEYFLESNNFFQSYKSGAHDQALHDVRNILNNNIFLDLKEIWLIDPYLSPNDILNIVMYCEKQNIKIMCLTDLRILRGKNEDGSKEPIDSLKHRFDVELDSAIPSDTDVQLTYKIHMPKRLRRLGTPSNEYIYSMQTFFSFPNLIFNNSPVSFDLMWPRTYNLFDGDSYYKARY